MGSCNYSTEHKKEVHYTLVNNTIITAVHNIHSGAQHIHDTETFRLPEHQVHDFRLVATMLNSSSHNLERRTG